MAINSQVPVMLSHQKRVHGGQARLLVGPVIASVEAEAGGRLALVVGRVPRH